MGFQESVKSGFDHYTRFDGRASRPMYWWWVLFAIIVGVVASTVDAIIGTPIVSVIVGLGLFLPGLSVAIRRLHDINRTGWWLLISLIPLIGFIVLLVFYLQEGDAGDNRYGSPPPSSYAPATA